MKTKVKVTLWEEEWWVLQRESGEGIENIPIAAGQKWGPLLKRAIEKEWQVLQYEDLAGNSYQWLEERQSWVPLASSSKVFMEQKRSVA